MLSSASHCDPPSPPCPISNFRRGHVSPKSLQPSLPSSESPPTSRSSPHAIGTLQRSIVTPFLAQRFIPLPPPFLPLNETCLGGPALTHAQPGRPRRLTATCGGRRAPTLFIRMFIAQAPIADLRPAVASAPLSAKPPSPHARLHSSVPCVASIVTHRASGLRPHAFAVYVPLLVRRERLLTGCSRAVDLMASLHRCHGFLRLRFSRQLVASMLPSVYVER